VAAALLSARGPGERRFDAQVLPEQLADRPASPWIYGNFIELGFGHQVDGMWAEMLWNRSFEEIPPYAPSQWEWLERKPGDDLTAEPWWHSGYEEHEWRLDPSNPDASLTYESYWGFRHGTRAAEVTNHSQDRPALLVQDGLYLRKGVTYRFSGWLATAGETGVLKSQRPTRVTVGLYPGTRVDHPLAEQELAVDSGTFALRRAELPSGAFSGRASFALRVEPGAGVRVDGFSLMPTDAVGGWRRDVVDALQRLKPPILRFPGGCFASFYNWRDGIGPAIDRRPRPSTYWGGLENNDVGVVEFVGLCREIGAEPFYCLNVLTGTPAEAADLVAYSNAGEAHALGRLRASHGHPEPLGIRYFELDNETYRRYGALEYAARCVEFARAVKAVDPQARLVMVGYWRFNPSLAQMLEIAGEWIDGVTDRATSEEVLRQDLAVLAAYNKAHGRSLFLCNTEWLAATDLKGVVPDALNRPAQDLSGTLQNRQIRWGYALNAAAQLLTFQRLGGGFLFATFNNLVNTWGQNVIESAKEGIWLSAAGRVFEAMAGLPASWPLGQTVRHSPPGIVSQPAWNRDRTQLVLQVINYGPEAVEAGFDLGALGFRPGAARRIELRAESLQARNTFADPDAVRREDRTEHLDHPAAYTTALAPYSLTLVVLSR
jgi:alpha-N-arabinofuranosidase